MRTLNGREIDGRALTVNEARPRENRAPRGGGGGGGRGFGGGGGGREVVVVVDSTVTEADAVIVTEYMPYRLWGGEWRSAAVQTLSFFFSHSLFHSPL